MWKLYISLLLFSFVKLSDLQRFTIYQTPESIISHGYPAERHSVTTEDGYILEMHRIPRGRNHTESCDRPVVFVMHGVLSASSGFIAVGPEGSIAYNLADAGFDVWMGNARGSRNSRNHTTLNPDDPVEKFQFFDFSFEEIGMKDIPAMVDYALNFTGKETLHYIGHSQGGTVFLILNSMRPEYNEKFKTAHLLSGVGYQDYFPHRLLRILSARVDRLYSLALRIGFVEVYLDIIDRLPLNDISYICDDEPECVSDVTEILTWASNYETGRPALHLGGGALKQLVHFGQNIRDRTFRRWNYGADQNQEIYGQDPPIYNLALITANVTMHYTLSDVLIDERDVLAMANDMPNTAVRKIARESFRHMDFIAAPDIKELVTDNIIEAIWSVENHLCGSLPDSSSNVFLSTLLKLCLLLHSLAILITFYH